MRRAFVLALVLILTMGGALWLEAPGPGPKAPPPRIGIVLIHGKQGSATQFGQGLATRFETAGYLVDRPDMCWSGTRIYDEPFLDCLHDIDASIERLKARGASQFVIAGQSLGASGALAFGARHDGLKGIIAMAPAPAPGVARRAEIAPELDRAKALAAAGHSDEKTEFNDLNVAVLFHVTTTPSIYQSFLAFDGPANLVANTIHLKAPVLWISGLRDPTQMPRNLGYDRAPPNKLNRYVEVEADHFGTPAASRDVILAWLKEITAP